MPDRSVYRAQHQLQQQQQNMRENTKQEIRIDAPKTKKPTKFAESTKPNGKCTFEPLQLHLLAQLSVSDRIDVKLYCELC